MSWRRENNRRRMLRHRMVDASCSPGGHGCAKSVEDASSVSAAGEETMNAITNYRQKPDPRPVIPALGRHYAFASDLAYLIVRLTAGLMLLPHGWPKVMTAGPA